jgi:hypothetical protein
MPVAAWLDQNWFSVLQTLGIVGALAFTAITLRTDTKIRRVQNHFAITEQHRKIWSELFARPELARVLEPKPDLARDPVTPAEDIFVTLLILNLNAAFVAMKADLLVSPEKLGQDIKGFLSLPIPSEIWKNLLAVQDSDFVTFVQQSMLPTSEVK